MRVKKYQAVDMPEALRKIKAELGPDAVILSTRQVKPRGGFGLLSRPILEVTAAAEVEITAPPVPAGRVATAYAPRPAAPPAPAPSHGAYLALQAEVDSLREELTLLSRRTANAATRRPPAEADGAVPLGALEAKLDRLLEQTARFDALRLAPGLRRLHGLLEAKDLDPGLAARVLGFLQEKIDQGALAEGREAEGFRELVSRTVRVAGGMPPPADGAGPRVVALVGPTGVGKTTTAAKLAARCALQEKRRVGLVTVDTFRIAAVEQLRTFAKIMDVPLRVALDAEGLRAAVADFADRDLVLVDTAGQSPRDEQALRDLLDLLPAEAGIEVHLVLSVTTRARDLERILRHYGPVRPSRLLLTKLDETDCHGPLLGLPLASRLPLSYLTTGQNVPDDIEEATPSRVAAFLLQGWDVPRSGPAGAS
ncbi:MAG: flagellar biosynthesis protein FlhF [Deltaproteobacteria bacterium]|nr:flagellar biosynthesis protein FlhF [Deltaproteobacteria bacterium]